MIGLMKDKMYGEKIAEQISILFKNILNKLNYYNNRLIATFMDKKVSCS